MARRVLITGGTGFVGANLARRLLHDGNDVHLLVRSTHQDWRIADVRTDLTMHDADLRDEDAVGRAVAGIRPQWIFHLAVNGAYSTQTDVQAIVRTNILGTVNLVQAAVAAGCEAFVNTGSSSEYGFKDHAPGESEWLEPNSVYAVTKASATLFCRQIAASSGLWIPTLRLYSAYGPYEEPTRLIPRLILDGLRGELPPLVDPAIARDFVYIDDVLDAYLLAAGSRRADDPGAIYNVGSGVQTSLREVVALARRVLGIAAEPAWGTMPARGWDTTVWLANNAKIGAELGWQPRHTFEEGFRSSVAWFRSAGAPYA